MKRPLLTVLILMLAVAVVGCNSSKRKAGDNVVAEVEHFMKSNGRLPNALSDMGIKEGESCRCYCKTGDVVSTTMRRLFRTSRRLSRDELKRIEEFRGVVEGLTDRIRFG